MRRILISPVISGLAGDYAKQLEEEKNFANGKSPKAKLNFLYNALSKSSVKIKVLVSKKVKGHPAVYKNYKGNTFPTPSDYVKAIFDNYDGLNNLLPSQYDEKLSNVFNPIIPSKDICKYLIKLPQKTWRPLSELIVEAMGYGKVQNDIFPKYVRMLGIKTCVYCNAQFATTTTLQSIKTYKNGLSKIINENHSCYDLDHNKPKSEFPFLCTNFYNLQPCCSSCNRKKNDRSLGFSVYYEIGDADTRPLHFSLKEDDIIKFRIYNVCQGVIPWLCNNGYDTPPSMLDKESLAGEFNYKLGIQDIYKEHTDVVEEVLWAHKIYSNGLITALNTQLPKLGLLGFDLKRFVLGGFYSEEKDFLKRPLSVMKDDIWEQINKNVLP